MAAYEDDQGPYRGYQPHNFDTGNLPPPVRGAAPVTSTFDQPPVRGVAPKHSEPPTSVFDKPPVRGVAPGGRASAPPLTTEFGEPPLRGVATVRATAPVTPPLTSRFDEPPVRGVAPGEAPMRLRTDNFDSAEAVERGQSPMGSGQTPIMDHTPSGGKGYGTFWMAAVANVLLRSLTSLCLVIALALFARFLSDLNDYTTGFSVASPKYALAATIIGVIYSLFQLTSAIFYLAMGRHMLPTKVSLLISYIGDQVFMVLLLSAGSAVASYITALDCSQGSRCARGAGGVAMEFLAFAFIAANSVLSTFYFYMTRT